MYTVFIIDYTIKWKLLGTIFFKFIYLFICITYINGSMDTHISISGIPIITYQCQSSWRHWRHKFIPWKLIQFLQRGHLIQMVGQLSIIVDSFHVVSQLDLHFHLINLNLNSKVFHIFEYEYGIVFCCNFLGILQLYGNDLQFNIPQLLY